MFELTTPVQECAARSGYSQAAKAEQSEETPLLLPLHRQVLQHEEWNDKHRNVRQGSDRT